MRLIDVDEAKKQIKQMQTVTAAERMLFQLALARTPTYEPPNPPLTLEELREMDGEPVWIECLFNENLSSYVVIDRCDNGIFTKLFYADFEYYNDEWLAYRRKPEKEGR